MKDGETPIIRIILTMVVIAGLGSIFLAGVYAWTNPYIQERQGREREAAIDTVLDGKDYYEEVKKESTTYFVGYDEAGNRTGVALSLSAGGYQAMIEVMVGVEPGAGKITGIEILDHEETPGLGARIEEQDFKDNFRDIPVSEYEIVDHEPETPEEISGIAGATISAETVVEIVEKAGEKVTGNY